MTTPAAIITWTLAIILTATVAAAHPAHHLHPGPHPSRRRTVAMEWSSTLIAVALAAAIALPATLLCRPTPTMWVA